MPAAPAFRAAEPAAEDWNGLPPPAAPPRHVTPAYAEPPDYAEDERYPAPVPGYEQGAEDPNHPHFADAQQEEYYQDAPPRRRWGILVMGMVFGLAVLGTAGAFGYRALYGMPGSSPPKVIAADPTPSKLTPPKKDLSKVAAAPSAAAEKLAPPPEPPVELKAKPPAPVVVNQANPPAAAAPPPAAILANGAAPPPAPAVASATLGSEPKKVHTIAIRPDMTVAEASPPPPAAAPPPPAPAVAPPAAPAAPAVRPAPAAPSASAPPAAPTRLAAAPSNGAPLSLSPDAPPAAPARPAPATRVTSVAPTAHVAAPSAAATGGLCRAGLLAPQRGRGAGRDPQPASQIPGPARRPRAADPQGRVWARRAPITAPWSAPSAPPRKPASSAPRSRPPAAAVSSRRFSAGQLAQTRAGR